MSMVLTTLPVAEAQIIPTRSVVTVYQTVYQTLHHTVYATELQTVHMPVTVTVSVTGWVATTTYSVTGWMRSSSKMSGAGLVGPSLGLGVIAVAGVAVAHASIMLLSVLKKISRVGRTDLLVGYRQEQ